MSKKTCNPIEPITKSRDELEASCKWKSKIKTGVSMIRVVEGIVALIGWIYIHNQYSVLMNVWSYLLRGGCDCFWWLVHKPSFLSFWDLKILNDLKNTSPPFKMSSKLLFLFWCFVLERNCRWINFYDPHCSVLLRFTMIICWFRCLNV